MSLHPESGVGELKEIGEEGQHLFDAINEAIAGGIRQVDVSIDLAVAGLPEEIRNMVANEIYDGYGRQARIFHRGLVAKQSAEARRAFDHFVSGVGAEKKNEAQASPPAAPAPDVAADIGF